MYGFHTRNDFLARIQPCENIDFGSFNKKSKYESYIEKSDEKDFYSEISIYPNPTGSNFTIELALSKNLNSLSIFDLTGKQQLKKTITNSKTSINIEHLKSGIYFIEVETGANIQHFKIIKK